MSDLISREEAIEAIQNAYCKPCKERGDDHNEVRCRACDYDNAIIQIDALPSAEAVHGEWKIDEYGIYHCPICHAINNTVYKSYCPNCGAKMEGREP